MSATKETNKDKVIVLAIDMDGCFACDFYYPALRKGRKDFVGLLVKLLNDNDVQSAKQVIVRPATARKDDVSDRLNADHYQTPLTSEVLFNIAAVIRDQFQDYESKIIVDDRLHPISYPIQRTTLLKVTETTCSKLIKLCYHLSMALSIQRWLYSQINAVRAVK